MKALQLAEPKAWRKIEIPHPDKPGPGEALVRIHRVGTASSGAEAAGGESCLIMGAAPMGAATWELHKVTGPNIIRLHMNDTRLKFCREVMGVQHTVKPSDKLEQDLRDLTEGHLPEVVIDATGNNASMSAAFGYVAPGGRLVYVGITTDEVKFRHPIFHRPEGTLLCSRNALPADFTRIIKLIEDGQINTQPWITHRAAFDDLVEVFPSY